jgi:integrase
MTGVLGARMKQTLKRVGECLCRSHESGVYYARVRRGRKLITRSLKTRSREVANWRLNQFLGKSSHLKPSLAGATYAEVVQAFRDTALAALTLKPASREDYEHRLKALVREWPGRDLNRTRIRDITIADCEKWFAKRRPQVGAQRLKNERNLLKNVFEFAKREGYTMENPAASLPRVRVPKSKAVPPTRAQFLHLVGQLRARHNTDAVEMVELLAYSGMRVSEAAGLRWADVDTDRRRFRVAGKGRGAEEYDEVPLFPAMRELLARIRQARGPVQPSDRVLRIRQCRDALAGACQAAGLPRFSHHDLRHFFCSEAIEKGIDFKTIAGWLRHKDGGMLAATTYGHLRSDHSDEMAEKMLF